jgi:6-phosphogluconolactonase
MQLHYFPGRTGFHKRFFGKLFVFAVVTLFVPAIWAKDCFVYFGTFTNTTSQGIYVSRLDMDSGKFSAPELAVAVGSPNYLAVSHDGQFLYAAARGTKGDVVDSFAIDNHTGALRLLDQKSSGGAEPCYVGIDVTGQNLFDANYNGATVKSFRINPDGTLTDGMIVGYQGHSVNPDRQKGPHPHCFIGAPAGRFALACDLGLDKIMVYRVNTANASLNPGGFPFGTVAPGSGPRHLAFSPDGKTACVINEMACTITVFDWEGFFGNLTARQTIPLLPPGEYQKTFTAAEIAYRPDGRFVYATVRGPMATTANTISVLAVDAKTGDLSLVQNISCGGNFPRGMGIDPSGKWLIIGNQKSGTVTVFGINADTGLLTPTGQVLSVGSAVDVKFAPRE